MPPRDSQNGEDETSLNSPAPPKSAQTTTTTTSRNPRKRSPLSPLPILDRKHLLSAVPSISSKHIDAFYQQLHQQSYPPLPEFVQTYHRIENEKKSPPSTKNRKKQIQLPQSFLQFLQTSKFTTLTSHVNSVHHSADDTTTKLTVALQDGHLVETVIMRHKNRNTICVSSQVGCAMKCTFCATGTMGLSGNLCQGEILEQMVHAQRILDSDNSSSSSNGKDRPVIRNVVFMGMGEPLQNYHNVVASCRALMDRRRWNLAYGRVTVSTVGITANMRRLTEDLPEVNMALSLHAPNQELRETIVPTARSYKIEGLIEALDGHTRAGVGGKKKKAMIEYVMLEGPTSTFECAHQIGKLCENRPQIVVNLIPYNQTNVEDVLNCPSETHTKQFQNIITSYGVLCYIRRTMGADIAGACGQLVVEKDIEDIVVSNPQQRPRGDDDDDGRKRRKKGMVVTRKSRSGEKKVVVASSTSDDNERWVKPLLMATALSGCCFVLSLGVWMGGRQAQRRR